MWRKLNVASGVDVVNFVLMPGEKVAIGDILLDFGGFNNELDGTIKKLIERGGRLCLLHAIFQWHNLLPSQYAALPYVERDFVRQSVLIALEEESRCK